MRASVLDMDSEYTSLAETIVNGTSGPSVCAMPEYATRQVKLSHTKNQKNNLPMAIAVFPVDGGPANSIARPAMRPSCTIFRIMPAALRALACPTMPCEFARGSNRSSKPSPRMWEWAPGVQNLV